MATSLDMMSNPLDNLHKIIEDLQHYSESCQKPQFKLCHAKILDLPRSETAQKNPKPCYAKITCHGGVVSCNVKIFQRYINQRYQNNKNPSL